MKERRQSEGEGVVCVCVFASECRRILSHAQGRKSLSRAHAPSLSSDSHGSSSISRACGLSLSGMHPLSFAHAPLCLSHVPDISASV